MKNIEQQLKDLVLEIMNSGTDIQTKSEGITVIRSNMNKIRNLFGEVIGEYEEQRGILDLWVIAKNVFRKEVRKKIGLKDK